MARHDINLIDFWPWLWHGSGGKPGVARVINRWTWRDLAIGAFLSVVVTKHLDVAATTILLPLAGVFMGLSFAWAGKVQDLLQTEEIEALAKKHPGGMVDYVYSYQLAICIVIASLAIWGLAGLGVFEWYAKGNPVIYFITKLLVYATTSFTVVACWRIVNGANWLIRVYRILCNRPELWNREKRQTVNTDAEDKLLHQERHSN